MIKAEIPEFWRYNVSSVVNIFIILSIKASAKRDETAPIIPNLSSAEFKYLQMHSVSFTREG